MAAAVDPLPTGPRVAMVGAGQLARMTHQAAIALDVELRVLAVSLDDPAVRAGAAATTGSPTDLAALRAIASDAAVLTFDHEHVPPEHLATLESEGYVLAPPADAKLLAQDKLVARRRLAALGFPVPPFAHARTLDEVERFANAEGWPVVAKAPRGGYDGRGVSFLAGPAEAEAAVANAADGLLLEPALVLERELAVLVARCADGAAVTYPVVETVQRGAMCREILAPAPIAPEQARGARALASAIAEAIGAVGVVAVELFATADGLVVNELALRPHNSGHWTIEGAVTSQFEQHLRAVLGWPLGDTSLTSDAVCTVNVVGDGHNDPADRLPDALRVPGAHVHLYGKAPRPGRKLGHVTVCGDDLDEARAAARQAALALEGSAAP